MKTIDRNPDVDMNVEKIPDGCYLQEGKRLQNTARRLGIPFGVAYSKTPDNSRTTHGLILRNEDKERFANKPNVKEHAPPLLKSDCAETEELHGGCCVSSCSDSSSEGGSK